MNYKWKVSINERSIQTGESLAAGPSEGGNRSSRRAGALEPVRVSDSSLGSGRCSLGLERKGRSPGARTRQSGFKERAGLALAVCTHRSQIFLYTATGCH